jgi:hypothetical protein
MDPYLVSFILGAVGAFCGHVPHIVAQLLGVGASFGWAGYLVYLVFDRSFGTAGLAFLSGVGGALAGTAAAALILAPVLHLLSGRASEKGVRDNSD